MWFFIVNLRFLHILENCDYYHKDTYIQVAIDKIKNNIKKSDLIETDE